VNGQFAKMRIADVGRIIPALKGKLKKIDDDLKMQRQTIDNKRSISIQQDKLAEGILLIEECVLHGGRLSFPMQVIDWNNSGTIH